MDLQAAIKLTLLGFDPAPVRAMSQAMKELAGGPAGPGGRGGDPLAQANKSALAWAANMRSLRTTTSMLSTSIGQLGRTAERTFETIGKGIVGIGKQALKTRTEFEMFERQLATLLGSEAAGKAGFAEVKKFALISPLTLKETMKSVNLLLNYGFKFNELMKQNGGIIDTMTKAAIFSQRPLEQVARSIEKIREGYWRAQYLGPVGITPQFLKGLGIEWDSKKNRPAGLDATTGQQMFDTIMKGLVAKFKNFDPRTTLQVMGSNIQDAIDYMFNGIGAAMEASAKRLAPKFQAAIKNLTSFFDSGDFRRSIDNFLQQVVEPAAQKLIGFMDKLVEYMKKNPDALAKALQTLTIVMKDLFAIWVGSAFTAGLLNFMEIILGIAAALGGGPIGVLAGGVIAGGGLIGAFTLLKKAMDDLIPAMDNLNDGMADIPDSSANAAEAQRILAEQFGATKQSVLDLITALLELASVQSQNAKTAQNRQNFQTLGFKSAAANGQTLQVQVGSPNGPTTSISVDSLLRNGLPKDTTYYYGGMPITSTGVTQAMPFQYVPGTHQVIPTPGAITQSQLPASGYSALEALGMQIAGASRQARLLAENLAQWPVGTPRDKTKVLPYEGVAGHSGNDFMGKEGDPIFAPVAGKLHKVGKNNLGDYRLWIQDLDGNRIYMTHFNEKFAEGVVDGADVAAGQLLGTMAKYQHRANGTKISAPHVHISFIKAGDPSWDPDNSKYDPMKYLFGGTVGSAGADAIAAANREAYYDWAGFNGPSQAAGSAAPTYLSLFGDAGRNSAVNQKMHADWLKGLTGNSVTEAVVAQYQAIVNATQAFVDGLQAQVDALSALKGRLRGVRDNIAVGFQEMMGWDRGADRERTLIAARNMNEAMTAWTKERDKARPNEQKLWELGIAAGDAIVAAQQTAANFRDKEGGRPFFDYLAPLVTDAMKQLGPALEKYQMTAEQRLSRAAGMQGTAALMLQQAAIDLANAAGAMRGAAAGGGIGGGIIGGGTKAALYGKAVGADTVGAGSGPAGSWADPAQAAGAPSGQPGMGNIALQLAKGNINYTVGGVARGLPDASGDALSGVGGAGWVPDYSSGWADQPSGYQGGFDYSGLDANTGGGCGPGGCPLNGAGLPGGSYPDKTDLSQRPGGEKGPGNPAQAGFNLVGMFMGGLTAGLQAFAQAALNGDIKAATQSALQAFASSLISSVQGAFGSSPMGQLMGGIAGAGLGLLFGKLFHKKKVVDVRVVEPVRVFPDTTSMGLSANPASRLFSGRGSMTGTGITVQLELKGEAGEILTGKIVTALNRSFALGTA